jgi:hydroxymethylbilane synthase
MRELVVGTRGSALALAQTQLVCAALRQLEPSLRIRVERITTTGDVRADVPLSALGRGIFVSEIEAALRDRCIDFAVHSAKDLPSTLSRDLILAAIPAREDPRDVLVSRSGTLRQLSPGARVGTSSPRRACQLRALRPDLDLRDMRGNVDTRLRKLAAGEYDAIVLAAAGLNRLGRADAATERLPPAIMIPCVGQGALAVEARADDAELVTLLAQLDHAPTRAQVDAERAFLAELGAGCLAAVAAHATIQGDRLELLAMIGDVDGRQQTSRSSGSLRDAAGVGSRLARAMLRDGAASFLARQAGGRPLENRRVIVTRPAAQSEEVLALLRARGAEAIAYPAIRIATAKTAVALERELRQLDRFDWVVFTSANAVRAVAATLIRLALTVPPGVRFAAVGQATANELTEVLLEPAFIASEASAASIGRELPITHGALVLLPRGDLASPALVQQLSGRGARVRDVIAYHTVPGEGIPDLEKALISGDVDAIVFASPSSVRFAAEGIERARNIGCAVPALVCIGSTTARAVHDLAFDVAATAATPATGDIVEAVERALSPATARLARTAER